MGRSRLKAIDVARGLEYLHNHNPPIRHGDIKGVSGPRVEQWPRLIFRLMKENVLINGNDEAVLTDFGLSSIVEPDQSDRSGSEGVQGTLRYMSPELLLEEDPPLTLESDIWALGCLFLEVTFQPNPHRPVPNISLWADNDGPKSIRRSRTRGRADSQDCLHGASCTGDVYASICPVRPDTYLDIWDLEHGARGTAIGFGVLGCPMFRLVRLRS